MKNLRCNLYAFTILSLIIFNTCTSQIFCAQFNEEFSKISCSNNESDTASCDSRSRSSSTASLSEQVVMPHQDLATAIRNPLHFQPQPAAQINPQHDVRIRKNQSCKGAAYLLIGTVIVVALFGKGSDKTSNISQHSNSTIPSSFSLIFNGTNIRYGADDTNPYGPSKKTLQLLHGNLRGSNTDSAR